MESIKKYVERFFSKTRKTRGFLTDSASGERRNGW